MVDWVVWDRLGSAQLGLDRVARGESAVSVTLNALNAYRSAMIPNPTPQPPAPLPHHRWIFRHILYFLRSDALPADPLLLEEMYNEANFYRLSSLRSAIEERAQDPQNGAVDDRQFSAVDHGLTGAGGALPHPSAGTYACATASFPDPHGFTRSQQRSAW